MYVFVTATEIEGPNKELDLGAQPDNASLKVIKDLVMSRIESDIPPDDRPASRHFWHNNRLCPDNILLADIASGNDIVSLELRQDRYNLLMGGVKGIGLIDPEEPIGSVIREVLASRGHRHGGECCYELSPRGSLPLDPHGTLFEEEVLPYEADLVLKRKRIFYVWFLALLVGVAVLGLLLGYVSGRFLG
jgi:hypothetical protein